jgi:hypothetical protein
MPEVILDIPQDLIDYAEWLRQYRGYHTLAMAWVEIMKAGKSRVEQLRKYAEKRKNPDATFRPYAPLKVSAQERGSVKRAAIAEGVATVKDPFPWRCTVRNEVGYRCTHPRHREDVAHKF